MKNSTNISETTPTKKPKTNPKTDSGKMGRQYEDQESGSHYNYFRDYNPATSRYYQADPVSIKDGAGKYEYSNGSPFRYFDVYGASPMQCCADAHKSDKDCCKEHNWPPPMEDRETAGKLICCGGRKVPCENPYRRRLPDAIADSAVSACINVHEKRHLLHSMDCEGCDNVPALSDLNNGWSKKSAECDSYKVEHSCLIGKKSGCRGSVECLKQIAKALASAKRHIEEYCESL